MPARIPSAPRPTAPVANLSWPETLEWHRRCEALRANPGVLVFCGEEGDSTHDCIPTRFSDQPGCTLVALGCRRCPCDLETDLHYCFDCRAVGIWWPREWPMPDDLLGILMPAVGR